MYNLAVAEAHTFFVGLGGWQVHNSSCDFKQLIDEFEQTYGSPNVHGYKRHGPGTTIDQQKQRAIDGTPPDADGFSGRRRATNSTRFFNEEDIWWTPSQVQSLDQFSVWVPPVTL